jgi:gluconokinase
VGGQQATTTLVLAGASGVGKTSVGHRLADLLGWIFADGDEFHPLPNLERMRLGHALTDEDRRPWLRRLAEWVGEREAAGENAVLTSSALKRAYRAELSAGHPSVLFVQLTADPRTLAERLEQRRGHWMPATLLPSQLRDLEPLAPDEDGIVQGSEGTPDETARAVIRALGLDPGSQRPARATTRQLRADR